MVVRAVLAAALATLEHVSGGPRVDCHLVVVYRLLRQLRAQVFHFLARHLLRRHARQLLGLDEADEHVLTQFRVASVLQVLNATAHAVLVLDARALEFVEDT